jgi:hypothetical protein
MGDTYKPKTPAITRGQRADMVEQAVDAAQQKGGPQAPATSPPKPRAKDMQGAPGPKPDTNTFGAPMGDTPVQPESDMERFMRNQGHPGNYGNT